MTADSQQPAERHWGIVGGGMMGLTLAHRLAQAGQRVTLLEAASEIGGLAGAWQLGDVVWDRHYHVMLLSDLHLRNLLREFDLESEIRWVETRTGFFTGGRLYSMSSNVEFLRFPPLNLLEKFRLGLTIFAASKMKNWKPLEQVLVAEWLRRWSGRGTFEKIWLPLLKAKLGEAYRRVSAVFIWTTIARMYRARRSGLKKEMFGYVPGGYARVLARIAGRLRHAGVDVQTSEPTTLVAAEGGGVRVETTTGAMHHFDRVVLTTPAPVASRLCPKLTKAEHAAHEQIEYLGILCASVLLKKPLASFYVTNITDPGVPFTAVIEMTALVDPAELDGRHLVYLPRYVTTDDPAWAWSDAELETKFLDALARMYPEFSPDDVLAFRVSRVKNVMALPTLGYSESLPSMRTSVPNVFVVNSAQIVKGTLNVNEVVEVAEDALRAVLLPSLEQVFIPTANTPESDAEAAGELITRS